MKVCGSLYCAQMQTRFDLARHFLSQVVWNVRVPERRLFTHTHTHTSGHAGVRAVFQLRSCVTRLKWVCSLWPILPTCVPLCQTGVRKLTSNLKVPLATQGDTARKYIEFTLVSKYLTSLRLFKATSMKGPQEDNHGQPRPPPPKLLILRARGLCKHLCFHDIHFMLLQIF